MRERERLREKGASSDVMVSKLDEQTLANLQE